MRWVVAPSTFICGDGSFILGHGEGGRSLGKVTSLAIQQPWRLLACRHREDMVANIIPSLASSVTRNIPSLDLIIKKLLSRARILAGKVGSPFKHRKVLVGRCKVVSLIVRPALDVLHGFGLGINVSDCVPIDPIAGGINPSRTDARVNCDLCSALLIMLELFPRVSACRLYHAGLVGPSVLEVELLGVGIKVFPTFIPNGIEIGDKPRKCVLGCLAAKLAELIQTQGELV